MTSKTKTRSELRQARAIVASDPLEARRIAEDLLNRMEGTDDLLGEVLHLVAQSRHYCGDQEGAFSAFQGAFSVESRRLERGLIYCDWAALELDRHCYDDALGRAVRGVALVESADPSNRDLARALLLRGVVFRHTENYDEAEQDYRHALLLIHAKRDADLHLVAIQNLSLLLMFSKRDTERVSAALKILDEAESLLKRYRVRRKSVQYASILWAKGIAYRYIAADEKAEIILNRARQTFFELEAFGHWNPISLDLIEVYMHYSRWGMVRKTVSEMIEYANDTEIIAVLTLFRDAVKADTVTDEILREVYQKIHGDQRKPYTLGQEEQIHDELEDLEPIGF